MTIIDCCITFTVIARNERGEYEGLAIKRYERRHIYGERSEKQQREGTLNFILNHN